MAFCTNCGKEIADGVKFCSSCGVAINEVRNLGKREEFFEGKIYKCPHCLKTLKSFTSICPYCKTEIRGSKVANSIQEFFKKIQESHSEEEKIQNIKMFPIPNGREDLFEFMLMATSNFDASYYSTHLNEEDVSDAWLAKIEQCYQKAKLFMTSEDLAKISEIYNSTKEKIKKATKKSYKWCIFPSALLLIGVLLMALPFFEGAVHGVGLILAIISVIYFIKNKKKSTVEIKDKTNIESSSGGFATWSIGKKVLWVILNLYTCFIPAIIYYFTKHS